MMNGFSPREKLAVVTLVALTAFLLLFRLGHFPLLDYDEATYGLVALESMQSGNYLSLMLHGEPWIDKPPLLFWLIFLSVKIFGASEFALRLPVALLGVAGVLLTGLLAWEISRDKRVALLAAAIILFSGELVFASRQIRMDVPVAVAILFSSYAFVRGWNRPVWFFWSGAGVAFGILSKSAVGLFAFPIMLVFAGVYRQWRWVRSGFFWGGILLAAALALPWHIYEWNIYGQRFLDIFLGRNALQRITTTVIGGGNTGWLYYATYLFRFTEPWFIALFAAAAWLAAARRNNRRMDYRLPLAAAGAALLIFTIFQLARTRLFYYIEPIYPFGAIFLASAAISFYNATTRKRFAEWALAALLVLGFANTIWQAFEIRGGRTGEFALAEEEKHVAELLLNQAARTVLTSNFYNYETISYYGSDGMFTLNPLRQPVPREEFFLIIPNEILRIASLAPELSARAEVIYQGPILSVFRMMETHSS